MRRKLLVVSGRFPYPSHKGDQLILSKQLEMMSKKWDIILATMYSHPGELKELPALERFCKETHVFKFSKIRAALGVMSSLIRGNPLQVGYFRDALFQRLVEGLVVEKKIDLVHVYMLRMSYVGTRLKLPKFISLIDSMHLNFSRRATSERGLMKAICFYEAHSLKRFEPLAVKEYDSATVVAETDLMDLRDERVKCFPLGVELPKVRNIEKRKSIIFSGNMGYYPNQHAVRWFCDKVFPLLRREQPDVTFEVVGKNVPRDILCLNKEGEIRIHGYVDSVIEVLMECSIGIAPMQTGSGMQIKILEGMACGLPMVVSSLGLGSVKALHGNELLVADEPREFAESCSRLLNSEVLRLEMGNKARKFIEDHHSWEGYFGNIQNEFERILGGDEKGREGVGQLGDRE